jgi:hypothetical protein
LVTALPTLADCPLADTEDGTMNETILLTLLLGAIVGMGAGFAYAWRLARKLEAHQVRLRDWDAYDWEAENYRAVQRLREAQR